MFKVKLIILFFFMSLGTIKDLSLGGAAYSVKFVEVMVVIYFIQMFFSPRKQSKKVNISKYDALNYIFWIACFIYSLILCFWSTNVSSAFSGSIILFFGILTLFDLKFSMDFTFSDFVRANRLLTISLFVQLLFNMFSLISSYGLDLYSIKLYANTLVGNSNAVSFYFVFTLIFEFILKNKNWFLYLVISSIGTVFTLSRGGIVSLAICIILYLLIGIINKQIKKLSLFISLVMLIAVLFIFLNYTAIGVELWSSLQLGLSNSSVGSRENLWSIAINDLTNKPFGNGIIWQNNPHNIVLRALRDLGIFFGPIFLILISYPCFSIFSLKIFKASKQKLAITIAYFSVFIHSLAEVFYLTSITLIYTLCILAVFNKIIKSEYLLSKSKK